jgi:hypothetical protein
MWRKQRNCFPVQKRRLQRGQKVILHKNATIYNILDEVLEGEKVVYEV